MYEKILVPLDGSKVGEGALSCVRDLFSKMSKDVNVEVTLLHVLSPSHLTVPLHDESYEIYFNEQDYEMFKAKFIEYLNVTGDMLRGTGIAVNVRVEVGDVPFQIVNVAEEMKADMIILSTHGHTGMQWAIGSNAYKLLQVETAIPITVVRPRTDTQEQ